MSFLYKTNKERYDFGFLETDLASGKIITIRPANKKEMIWAEKELDKHLNSFKEMK